MLLRFRTSVQDAWLGRLYLAELVVLGHQRQKRVGACEQGPAAVSGGSGGGVEALHSHELHL